MALAPTDQCIVLPFRVAGRQPFDGTGLALHFLMGNVLSLHTGLKEMWFGWRVKKIFPRPEMFQRYCRDGSNRLDLTQISRSQKVRFWLSGSHTDQAVSLHRFDAESPHDNPAPIELAIALDDGLVGFRSGVIDWLSATAHPMPQEQIRPALWPESISREGLDAVGRALEGFYIYSAYDGNGALDISPFKKAVAVAPESFMAQNLNGWALYRNRDYVSAKIAFLTALRINPAGTGAMSGLMWCGVYVKDLEEAMYWSGRKADVCHRDVQAARESGRRRYEKANR